MRNVIDCLDDVHNAHRAASVDQRGYNAERRGGAPLEEQRGQNKNHIEQQCEQEHTSDHKHKQSALSILPVNIFRNKRFNSEVVFLACDERNNAFVFVEPFGKLDQSEISVGNLVADNLIVI